MLPETVKTTSKDDVERIPRINYQVSFPVFCKNKYLIPENKLKKSKNLYQKEQFNTITFYRKHKSEKGLIIKYLRKYGN
mgnify:CR=1 FL=1